MTTERIQPEFSSFSPFLDNKLKRAVHTMPEVPRTHREHKHDLVCDQNECKQGMNPAKITRGARQPKIFCQPVVPDAHVTWRVTSP